MPVTRNPDATVRILDLSPEAQAEIAALIAGGGGGGGGVVTQGPAGTDAWLVVDPDVAAAVALLAAAVAALAADVADGVTVTGTVGISGTVDVSDRVGRLLGHVTVDGSALPAGAATEATLESLRADVAGGVTVNQPVTVDGPLTDTQLRAVAVPVSAAALPLPAGAATAARQDTGNASIASVDGKVPDESGVWDYRAGVDGNVVIPAGGRVLGITAQGTAATVEINGGDPVPVDGGVGIAPRGNLTAPTLDFTGTTAFFVEFVT